MKKRTQIVFVGIALLALAAFSSMKRASPSKNGSSGGACCPLMQSFNQMSWAAGTNAPAPAAPTDQQPATNLP
jgi:hypothetical protein